MKLSRLILYFYLSAWPPCHYSLPLQKDSLYSWSLETALGVDRPIEEVTLLLEAIVSNEESVQNFTKWYL